MAEIRGASWDDLGAVHELLAARGRAAFGTSEARLEHLREAWELPSFEVGLDNFVATDDGRVVGYASLDSGRDLTHAAVDPAIGDVLLRLVEERARTRGFEHVAITAVPEDEPLYALVQRNGFELDRETWRMWRQLDGDLPEPVWPDGVTVRTYADADGERVHALLDEAYGGWDAEYAVQSHADWLKFMTGNPDDFDPELWFLVERDGELVATSLHWREFNGHGWVKDIVVRESERGRGLGKALLLHAFRAYAARGVTRVGLKVDSTNPTGAPQLYERVGMETDRRYGYWLKRL